MTDEPDSYSRHEALHMALFLAESVETQLVQNEWVETDAGAQKLADKAAELLNDLYQYIGSKHFED
ncbi:MAG: hypothetical protein KKA05_01505 [Alphaproteobacteria bacterium]|nr:hypothetical protein [Alphaproteobacteria bacterium]